MSRRRHTPEQVIRKLREADRLLGRARIRRLTDLQVPTDRACRFIGQHRSTQRRAPRVAGDDQALRAALRQIAADRVESVEVV